MDLAINDADPRNIRAGLDVKKGKPRKSATSTGGFTKGREKGELI
jgi:hypothetical protein